MTAGWGKASWFRGQEGALPPTQPLLGQESFKEKVLLQPGWLVHCPSAAWLIRLLSISANNQQMLDGLARMLLCPRAGEVGGFSLHPCSSWGPTSSAPSTSCRGEVLWGGCGFVPIWPETWQTHFVPAAAWPEDMSCSGVGMGAAPRRQLDSGLRACVDAPLPFARLWAEPTHAPGRWGDISTKVLSAAWAGQRVVLGIRRSSHPLDPRQSGGSRMGRWEVARLEGPS